MISSDPLSSDMSHSQLASEALFNITPPSIAPDHIVAEPASHNQAYAFGSQPSEPEVTHAKSSWLDAMPVDDEYELQGEYFGISAVNSDDNGLYRLFIGVSP